MKLWIVRQYYPEKTPTGGKFSMVGIFDSKELALSVCVEDNQCIAPVELNKDYGGVPEPHWGAYYPNLETVEEANERWKEWYPDET